MMDEATNVAYQHYSDNFSLIHWEGVSLVKYMLFARAKIPLSNLHTTLLH